jgi:hypothetical protein
MWRTQWLGDGWDLVLHQKLLHCELHVTGHIVMVQEPVVCPFFYPFLTNGIPQESSDV